MEKRNDYFYSTGRVESLIPEFSRIPTLEYIFMVDREIVAKLEYGKYKNRNYSILRYGINKNMVNFGTNTHSFKDTIIGLFRNSTYSITSDYSNIICVNDMNPFATITGLRIIIDFLRHINIRKELVIYEYSNIGGLLKRNSDDIRSFENS